MHSYAQHDDENQYTSNGSLRELPVGARQCESGRGIPFGVALLNEITCIYTDAKFDKQIRFVTNKNLAGITVDISRDFYADGE